MNKAPGFPAPTLPAPSIRPVAPASVAPSPTPFAMPTDAPVNLPAPSAAQPLTAPSLPDVAVPALPLAGDVTSSPPPPTPHGEPDPQTNANEDSPNSHAKARRSRAGKFLAVLLLVGAGAIAFVGFTGMADDNPEGTSEPEPVAPAPTSPLVAPINDAEAVVDQINDNRVEEEVLEELDLGPLGDVPVAEAPGPEADVVEDDGVAVVSTPTFMYRVQRGTAIEQAIVVDASSGNREVFDGSTYVRIVDGVVYSTTDPDASWIVDPVAAPSEPLASLTAMVNLEHALPAGLLEAVAVSAVQDENGTGRYLFIDSGLAMAAGDARAAWLTSWGFDATIEPTATEGFIDGVPDTALPGMILVSIVSDDDGVVTSLTIDAPGIGESVSYRLEAGATEPVTIGIPASITE